MIYLMCGIPASGKSTYIKKHATIFDHVISRDEIRKSLLKDGEDYFAHEKEVLKKFKEQIEWEDEDCLTNIWIDATHISRKTRKRILSHIKNNKVTCIYFKPDIEKSIERNKTRMGRNKVPDNHIIAQARRFEEPSYEEGFDYIIEVK